MKKSRFYFIYSGFQTRFLDSIN